MALVTGRETPAPALPVATRLHTVDRLDVDVAPVRGHIEVLCGHRVPVDATIELRPSGALCLPCVVGVTSDAPDPGRYGGLAL